jgi:hypothetical protein
MSLRKRLLLVVLAVGAVCGGIALISRDAEPVYKGKTLKQWMNIYRSPDNPTLYDLFPRRPRMHQNGAFRQTQSEAGDAVRHIGTNAIPTLLRWEDQDARVAWKCDLTTKLPKLIREQRVVHWWLIAADHYRVDRALFGFYLLGSNALPAVPELTRRMMTRSSDSGVDAAVALGNIGGAALPALISAATNTQIPNRVLVVRSLASATRAASNDLSGIVVLARCVQDTNAAVAA